MATAGGSLAAQAASIDFGVAAFGGTITYTGGATLDNSSSLDLDVALLAVSNVGPGDDSGLTVFPFGTSNTVAISPSDIVYGSGTGSSPLGSAVFETWTAGGDSYTENLTVVLSINRTNPDAITVVLGGTISDTRGLFPTGSPALLTLTASQAGGPGGAVAASLASTSTRSAVPEPSTWVMMLVAFGALGRAASRGRKSNTSRISA
jgi:hypothetical protein